MKKLVPNTLTCCNLLCGTMAIMFAYNCQYPLALLLIILGAVFDFFDGFSARLLHVSSPIGKELDSLADIATFGIAPSTMVFSFLLNYSPLGWFGIIALLMVAFSALRLAKFNLDERQTTSFIGLATPANALFWAALIATLYCLNITEIGLWWAIIMLIATCFSSWLLISEIPFFSLKFHDLSWQNNKMRFVFLGVDILIIIASVIFSILMPNGLGYSALISSISIIIIWYIMLNLINNIISPNEGFAKK